MTLFDIFLTSSFLFILFHFVSVSVSVNGFEGMVQQGLTEDEAKAMFYLVDENGLLSQVRSYVCLKVFISLLVPSCFCS